MQRLHHVQSKHEHEVSVLALDLKKKKTTPNAEDLEYLPELSHILFITSLLSSGEQAILQALARRWCLSRTLEREPV